jgi:16S rRNA (uracil1498-N3)-methyltransferase
VTSGHSVTRLAQADAATHVLVVDVEAPHLDSQSQHHLERVLRLRPGTPITVGDGRGMWRLVRFGPMLDPFGEIVHEPAPSPETTVACALAKSDKPDLVVQKLTELGVDRVVFFPATRSVVRWEGDRADRHVERLQRVAEAAVMQCRRAWSPNVSYVSDLRSLVGQPGVVRANLAGIQLTSNHTVVLIGPEGGWDPLDGVDAVPSVGFGPNVLRAETAAIAAGAQLATIHLFR